MNAISLLYHDVIPDGNLRASGFSGADADIYKLNRSDFAQHLALVSLRVKPAARLRSHELTTAVGGQVVLLTFDDGGVSAIEHTAPMLEECGWRGHFFITTEKIGQPGFLSPPQIRALHERGHVIGSHSVTHPARMSHCTPGQLLYEWQESTARLADIIGAQVESASVPGGYHTRRVTEAASIAGIRILFNSEPLAHGQISEECLVLGRYSIQRQTPAATAAALAGGDWLPRFQQSAYWNTKKVLKSAGGRYWLGLRKRILAFAKPSE